MKKIFCFLFFSFCFFFYAHSQKPSKEFAEKFCGEAMLYLKNSDTADFVKLWTIDNHHSSSNKNKFTIRDVKELIGGLREFLDTALSQNLPIDDIDIEKVNIKEDTSVYHIYLGSYNIKIWYKYNNHHSKGIGFHMDYINGKWVCCCWEPDTSVLTSQ